METVVRFEGVVAEIMNELVESRYFKTRSEAIRAGILELGKEYHILEELKSDLSYAKELDAKITSGEMELGTEKDLRNALKRKKG